MKAIVLRECCEIDLGGEPRKDKALPLKKSPLEMIELPVPVPETGQILLKVSACGICHTELDEIEGRLIPPSFPLVLGHEVVGEVAALGSKVTRFKVGDRVGVGWINSTCGACKFCERGDENLCDQFRATGLHAPGGYAQYTTVSESFAYPIPDFFSYVQAAPLLCAGIIGYRALRLSGIKPGGTIGLFGFGASAHMAIQVAKFWDCSVFVFTREGRTGHQNLAMKLGADWVGSTEDLPPEKLDCAIDFTPVGATVREALRVIEKGGRVVINAIRKVDPVPELDYTTYIWNEKELKSVANVTRQDALEFLPLAAEIGITPEVQVFNPDQVNDALLILKRGAMQGAGVLNMPQ